MGIFEQTEIPPKHSSFSHQIYPTHIKLAPTNVSTDIDFGFTPIIKHNQASPYNNRYQSLVVLPSTLTNEMKALSAPTTFTTAISTTNPLPLHAISSLFLSPPAANILSSNTTFTKISDLSNPQKAYVYTGNYNSFGAYIHPNAITGSGHNKTALLWPNFETCQDIHFLHRSGNCYIVKKYSKNDQIVSIVFWGILVGILGCIGAAFVLFILTMILGGLCSACLGK